MAAYKQPLVDRMDPVTPEHHVHEGISSTGELLAAPWLPVIRPTKNFNTYVVITRGAPVAFATKYDTATKRVVKFGVPAGYALDTNKEIKYTRDDVRAGLTNAAGKPVTEGESVLESMEAEGWKVSSYVGVADYDVFANPGHVNDPCKYYFTNFNRQASFAFTMDYVIRMPMVADKDTHARSPLAGIAAFIGKEALPGQFITYDKDSNYVIADANGFGFGTVKPEYIIGQVTNVHIISDPDDYTKVIRPVNQTDRIIMPKMYNEDPLNVLPNAKNKGVPQSFSYANAYGEIHFSLTQR